MKARLKQRLLSEWLGMPYSPALPSSPSDLRAAFQKAFTRLGLGARFQETTLNDGWEEIVGPTLAAHCHPCGVRRGVLCVLVDHPAWLYQIVLAHKMDILRAVQARFPHLKVQELNLRIG